MTSLASYPSDPPLATEPGPTDQPDSVSSQPTSEPGESVSIATEGANDGEKDSTTVSSSTADKANSDARHQAQTLALQQKVSNLELENRLLKREVASMNDELSSVMGRVREAGEGVRQYEVEITSLREQASQADHVIRQLRSHEEDLQAALEARDSQTQVRKGRGSYSHTANGPVYGCVFPLRRVLPWPSLLWTNEFPLMWSLECIRSFDVVIFLIASPFCLLNPWELLV